MRSSATTRGPGHEQPEPPSRNGSTYRPRVTPEDASREGARSARVNERDDNRGSVQQGPASHKPSYSRSARGASLPRCKTPRRWLGEFGDRAPEPRDNRAQRRRKGARSEAPTRGPRAGRTGAGGASSARAAVCHPGVKGGASPPCSLDTCKHFDEPRQTCGERAALSDCDGPPTRGPAVHPSRLASVWSWRRAVSKELDSLVAVMPQGRKRKGLSHRARRMRSCGTVAKVRSCGACGIGRAGSGRIAHPCDDAEGNNAIPQLCEARSCWVCQRRRAAPLREWLAAQVTSLPLPDDQTRWVFVTIAPQYDPDDPAEVSPEGLRDRLAGVRAAARAIIREGRAAIHAAFVAFELAGTGHVHAHAMIAARYLDREWLDRTAARACGREVHVWIEAAKPETAREVAKYTAKLVSPLDEGAIDGEPRRMIAPALAAAWEVATYGARMHERFGALRRAPMIQGGEPPAPQDNTTHCAECGTVGEWRWTFRPLRAWVRECRARGVSALEGSLQLDRRTRDEWSRAFDGSGRRTPVFRGRAR